VSWQFSGSLCWNSDRLLFH